MDHLDSFLAANIGADVWGVPSIPRLFGGIVLQINPIVLTEGVDTLCLQ